MDRALDTMTSGEFSAWFASQKATIPFKPYREPSPEVVEFYRNYEPTVEDLLAIEEFLAEEEAVAAGREYARIVSETSTVSERTEGESPLIGALLRLCEEVHA